MPLLRGIARTAAIAGTATAVSNRVSRRQQNRWAQQEDQQYAQQQPQRSTAAPACATGERHGRPAQRSRRTQVAGHPHRRRVRRAEGQDPGLAELQPISDSDLEPECSWCSDWAPRTDLLAPDERLRATTDAPDYRSAPA